MRYVIITILLCFFTTEAFSQSKKTLICDETWIQDDSKTFKVITTNDQIAVIFIQHMGERLIMKRYTVDIKQDRKGTYAQYTFFYNSEDQVYLKELLDLLRGIKPKVMIFNPLITTES